MQIRFAVSRSSVFPPALDTPGRLELFVIFFTVLHEKDAVVAGNLGEPFRVRDPVAAPITR